MTGGRTGNMEDIESIFNSWADGSGIRFNATLTIKDKEDNSIRRVNYVDNVPAVFTLPPVNASRTGLLNFNLIYEPRTVQTI